MLYPILAITCSLKNDKEYFIAVAYKFYSLSNRTVIIKNRETRQIT